MKPVIGLEIHIQADTKSKMFSSVDANYFGDPANSHVDPVSLGLPGALPVPNKEAIRRCILLSLALNCKINQYSKFDRKNYFYPDLPKGYQISQYDLPFGYDGFLEVETREGKQKIRIKRVHMEEDTGKSIHEGKNTLLDYNKSGMPLIEVVTEPDFTSLEQVTVFSKMLRQIVIYTGVSQAEMQKGQMRFELNLSVKTNEPENELPNYRVEVKNIGSISVLEKVIQFEVARQGAELEAGQKIVNQTRGLKDMTGETVLQRKKETADDYRYFPEPDIPPIVTSDEELEAIRQSMPELPQARRQRYMDWGVDGDMGDTLVDQRNKGDWLDQVTQSLAPQESKEIAKLLAGEISGQLEKMGKELSELPFGGEELVHLVKAQLSGEISSNAVKTVITKMLEGEGKAEELLQKYDLKLVSDPNQLASWVDQAFAENAQIVASIAKNPNAAKALIGKVMAISKGKADPKQVEAKISEKLQIT